MSAFVDRRFNRTRTGKVNSNREAARVSNYHPRVTRFRTVAAAGPQSWSRTHARRRRLRPDGSRPLIQSSSVIRDTSDFLVDTRPELHTMFGRPPGRQTVRADGHASIRQVLLRWFRVRSNGAL